MLHPRADEGRQHILRRDERRRLRQVGASFKNAVIGKVGSSLSSKIKIFTDKMGNIISVFTIVKKINQMNSTKTDFADIKRI